MPTVRVFRYIESLDAFVVSDQYRAVADRLGLTEWHPAVWIGRLFVLDNDYGEHWFDNWDEREVLADQAAQLGLDSHELMIVVPERFADGRDGPCHSPELRKRFWTDVLKSLELSCELLFEEARSVNVRMRESVPDEYIDDLEERIHSLRTELRENSA